MSFVKLTMLTRARHHSEEEYTEEPATTETEVASPVLINPAAVRCIYARRPRRDGSIPAGTRITSLNGAGLVVQEDFDQVAAAFGYSN